MNPATRTPEGEPNRCPLCGNDIVLVPSHPPGDAPCPHCGQLLWFDPTTNLFAHVFTIGEAARICRVSTQTIIRCTDKGELDCIRASDGKRRRIPRSSLRVFMTSYGIPTTALDASS